MSRTRFRPSRYEALPMRLPARFALRSAVIAGTAALLAATSSFAAMCVPRDSANADSNPPASSPASSFPYELQQSDLKMIYNESFDDLPYFAPGKSARCTTGSEAACSKTPDGWTHYYSSEAWNPGTEGDSSLHPAMEITDETYRGSSGKSLRIWDESWGSRSQWGSDAVLATEIDSQKDVYVELYVKFQPGFRWASIEDGSGTDKGKIVRLAHFGGPDSASRFQFFSGGQSAPIALVDLKNWTISSRESKARPISHIRCAPQRSNYSCGGYAEDREAKLPGDPNFVQSFGDGAWHKIGFRLKMNSRPGAADGKLMVWYDDILVQDRDDVPFLGNGADAGKLWNMFMIGGNMHNIPASESERLEQWWAIDDVRVYSVR